VSEKQVEDEADTGKYNPSYRESHKDHEQGQVYGLYDVCKRRLATIEGLKPTLTVNVNIGFVQIS
jgi:hypothetical protein